MKRQELKCDELRKQNCYPSLRAHEGLKGRRSTPLPSFVLLLSDSIFSPRLQAHFRPFANPPEQQRVETRIYLARPDDMHPLKPVVVQSCSTSSWLASPDSLEHRPTVTRHGLASFPLHLPFFRRASATNSAPPFPLLAW